MSLESAEHEMKAFSCSQNHVWSENCERPRGPGIVWFPVIAATLLDLKCWRDLFPPALLWAARGNSPDTARTCSGWWHISELVYKALQLLGRRLVCIWQGEEKVMFCVWCTLHISAPPEHQQDTVRLSCESLEKGFECFSHIITAELEWCHDKSIFRETAISKFFFFCW